MADDAHVQVVGAAADGPAGAAAGWLAALALAALLLGAEPLGYLLARAYWWGGVGRPNSTGVCFGLQHRWGRAAGGRIGGRLGISTGDGARWRGAGRLVLDAGGGYFIRIGHRIRDSLAILHVQLEAMMLRRKGSSKAGAYRAAVSAACWVAGQAAIGVGSLGALLLVVSGWLYPAAWKLCGIYRVPTPPGAGRFLLASLAAAAAGLVLVPVSAAVRGPTAGRPWGLAVLDLLGVFISVVWVALVVGLMGLFWLLGSY